MSVKSGMHQPLLEPSEKELIIPQLRTKLQIKKIGLTTVKQIMKGTCPEIATEEYIDRHRSQLNKSVYEFELRSDWQTWTISKRIEDFVEFEKVMRKRYGAVVLNLPVRKQSQNNKPAILLDFFELFLQQLSKMERIKGDYEFLKFMNMPCQQEKRKLKIYIQEYIKKRAGGRHNEQGCRKIFSLCGNWKKRFFTVSSQGIFYSVGHLPHDSQIKEMIPFSFHFSIEAGKWSTGQEHGIVLNSCQRILQLLCDGSFFFVLFIRAIKKSLSQNHYLELNRYKSFAPVRDNCDAKYYVDGQEYFLDVMKEMKKAQRQIFITDWMMTPYFLLSRPQKYDSDCRLDKILKGAAQRGVKINIVLFLQPKLALNNDSQHVQQYLQSLNGNIKVLRHPNFILIPFLWSHHEKIVIVDQKVGFLGGLDLCYGRMDNCKHLLRDKTEGQVKYWMGADYANFRISDIYTPRNYEVSMLDHNLHPRMPWHDIAVKIQGQSVTDLTRHFVQYWNFVNFQTRFNDRQLLMQAGITKQLQEENEHQRESIEKFRESMKKFQESKQMYRSSTPDYTAKSRSATNMSVLRKSQQVSLIHRQRSMSMVIKDPIQRLETINTIDESERQFYRQFLQKQEKQAEIKERNQNFNEKLMAKFDKLKKIKLNPFEHRQAINTDLLVSAESISKGKQRHQILRSAATWSLGIEEGNEEKSIYNAYIELISEAKEFIYIQNQFFISVENKVVDALAMRIRDAYQKHQKFKVMVILPLLPGFQGQIDNENAAVLRIQMHLQYHTISRGNNSIYYKLKDIENIEDYLQFYCLRTHDLVGSQPTTQIIYVHSKLLIIDDEVALIGSANINDRSMLGTRDSEIAVVIEGGEEVQLEKRKVKKFAHNLRVQLYMEHFAITKEQAQDYGNEAVWDLIRQRAKKNTLMYRQIFACYPDDEARDLFVFKSFRSERNLERYEILKTLIVGHVVQFPRYFMENERLTLRASQKEFYVPEISFT